MYRQYDRSTTKHSQSFVKEHQWGITLGAAVVGVILIVGFLLSGGTTPNNRGIGSIFEPIPAFKSGLGSINGYVAGPMGLPAVGSTVIAAEQGGTGITETQFVSIDGKYVFSDLPPGNYIIMAAFPDGSSTSLDDVRIQAGSVQTFNIKH